eukprot:CAMPEP_0197077156 /NCGR_PEP_ID=MMETSP1384-20130603/212478_1 /TAXON_ID=29189 /ORGANISM="Ammonia sp." /LENGTH=513 /DNA_ID=CAMNT_0042516015 /DNA_START=596 /DNA_END=2137 /DNA_ORIENTATION=+
MQPMRSVSRDPATPSHEIALRPPKTSNTPSWIPPTSNDRQLRHAHDPKVNRRTYSMDEFEPNAVFKLQPIPRSKSMGYERTAHAQKTHASKTDSVEMQMNPSYRSQVRTLQFKPRRDGDTTSNLSIVYKESTNTNSPASPNGYEFDESQNTEILSVEENRSKSSSNLNKHAKGNNVAGHEVVRNNNHAVNMNTYRERATQRAESSVSQHALPRDRSVGTPSFQHMSRQTSHNTNMHANMAGSRTATPTFSQQQQQQQQANPYTFVANYHRVHSVESDMHSTQSPYAQPASPGLQQMYQYAVSANSSGKQLFNPALVPIESQKESSMVMHGDEQEEEKAARLSVAAPSEMNSSQPDVESAQQVDVISPAERTNMNLQNAMQFLATNSGHLNAKHPANDVSGAWSEANLTTIGKSVLTLNDQPSGGLDAMLGGMFGIDSGVDIESSDTQQDQEENEHDEEKKEQADDDAKKPQLDIQNTTTNTNTTQNDGTVYEEHKEAAIGYTEHHDKYQYDTE